MAKNTQAKVLINQKISSVITNQLNESQMAHEQWEILSQCYSCNNLLSQYELHAQIHSEKHKDADNAFCYLRVFKDACHRFIQMEVNYSNDESIFDLLQDLPAGIEWEIFNKFTMNHISSSITSWTSTPLTFDDVTKLFTEKANTIVGKRKLAGPCSEYTNITVIQSAGMNLRINPVTGLWVHCVLASCMLTITTSPTVIGLVVAWRVRLLLGFSTRIRSLKSQQ